jgi:hypothetical protein
MRFERSKSLEKGAVWERKRDEHSTAGSRAALGGRGGGAQEPRRIDRVQVFVSRV